MNGFPNQITIFMNIVVLQPQDGVYFQRRVVGKKISLNTQKVEYSITLHGCVCVCVSKHFKLNGSKKCMPISFGMYMTKMMTCKEVRNKKSFLVNQMTSFQFH